MISIIVPTLNEEKYLPYLLGYFKEQDFKDYEIIIADGGSRDRTLEIAENFKCKTVKGDLPAKGKNEGAKAAKGDLILFLDADTVFLPEGFLSKALKKFEARNLGAATFPIYPVKEYQKLNKFDFDGNKLDTLFYGIYNLWVKLTQNFLPHALHGIMVKREIHQKIKGFDEKITIAEDHDYVRRAQKYGKFGLIEIGPILTSSRRFEKDGRIKTYFKYVLAGTYILFLGPVKSNFFRYRFNHYRLGKIKKERDL